MVARLVATTSHPSSGSSSSGSASVRYHPECICAADHTGQLCSPEGFQHPPRFQVVTGDFLTDMTGDDEEMYYLRTADMHRLHRYACTCTSMHAPAQVCMHLHRCACTCTSMHAPAQVCMHLHRYACTCTDMHTLTEVCMNLHR